LLTLALFLKRREKRKGRNEVMGEKENDWGRAYHSATFSSMGWIGRKGKGELERGQFHVPLLLVWERKKRGGGKRQKVSREVKHMGSRSARTVGASWHIATEKNKGIDRMSHLLSH